MIRLTVTASRQLRLLRSYYIEQQRPKALLNLGHALAEASLLIANAPERGLPAPRPYPDLANLGFLWLKRGRYWIAFDRTRQEITGIFFETDDIPNRIDQP